MLLIILIIRTAYVTLFERKILSYLQNRKGPNKPLFLGIIIPMLDGIKLMFKQFFLINIKLFLKYFIFLFFCFIIPLIILFNTFFIFYYKKKKRLIFFIIFIISLFGLFFILNS